MADVHDADAKNVPLSQNKSAATMQRRSSGDVLFFSAHCCSLEWKMVTVYIPYGLDVRLRMQRKPSLVASYRQLRLGHYDVAFIGRQNGLSTDG